MHRIRATLTAGMLAAIAVLALPAMSASAASAPPNDNPGGAKVIGSLPYSAQQNTGAATTSDLERRLNDQCFAPAVGKGVWYKYTAGGTFSLKLSGEGSSYSVGLLVTQGPPANGAVVGCSAFTTFLDVTKGTTYWILVFDFTPGSAGGTLRLSASKAAAAPDGVGHRQARRGQAGDRCGPSVRHRQLHGPGVTARAGRGAGRAGPGWPAGVRPPVDLPDGEVRQHADQLAGRRLPGRRSSARTRPSRRPRRASGPALRKSKRGRRPATSTSDAPTPTKSLTIKLTLP